MILDFLIVGRYDSFILFSMLEICCSNIVHMIALFFDRWQGVKDHQHTISAHSLN